MKVRAYAGVLLAAGVSVASFQARALSITPATLPVFTSTQTSALSAAQVASLVGYAGTLALVYKSNVDGIPAEEGNAAAYYSTIFDLTPNDPSKATITWDGPTNAIVCPDCYLVVKDGNQNPAQYVYDISSWNGVEAIELSGFWPAQGAISHVAIFNNPGEGGGTVGMIPEADTYALLLVGLGLVGFAVRRKRS